MRFLIIHEAIFNHSVLDLDSFFVYISVVLKGDGKHVELGR